MNKQLAIITSLSLLALSSCPFIGGSRAYRGATKDEQAVFELANREVLPDDVRSDFEAHRDSLVAWTGIIVAARESVDNPGFVEYLIDHHYWDWVEDYGLQSEVAFLSPRGEGQFSLGFEPVETSIEVALTAIDGMVIAYGTPAYLNESSGTVFLSLKHLRILPPSWYATDIWDYGREYVLHRDKTDFEILRSPVSFD